MPRNRKLFIKNTPIMITSRTEEGLPFLASVLMNQIIWSALAKAQAAYPIRICHFVFMGNHFHLLAVVDDPEMVSHFVRYLKTETSHAVNRLLGRRKRTIWSEGYDSPTILTPEDVIRYITYIYCNPSAARLVGSIRDFEGVASWAMFKTKRYSRKCQVISRDRIKPFDLNGARPHELETYTNTLGQQETVVELLLEPFAWIQCFPELSSADLAAMEGEILDRIESSEKKASFQPLKEPSTGKAISSTFTPQKFGRRMICLCSDPIHRRNFINWYRVICEFANQVYQAWKVGDFSKRLPAGILAPGNFSLASINPALRLA